MINMVVAVFLHESPSGKYFDFMRFHWNSFLKMFFQDTSYYLEEFKMSARLQ